MVNPYNKILFSHKQEWSTDLGYNMDELGKHYAKWSTKHHTLNVSSYKKEIFRMGKSVEREGLPQWFSRKESTCRAGATGEVGSSPGLGRSPGGGHGSPLQYSCLKTLMDRGAWRATDHEILKSRTWKKQLGPHAHRDRRQSGGCQEPEKGRNEV